MARLKLAPYSEGMTETKLPKLGRDLPASKVLSRLELMRTEYQERALREKEEKLLTMFTQQQCRAQQRIPRHFHHNTVLHPDSRSNSEWKRTHPLSHPPALYPGPWTQEDKTWASNWTVTKRSAGVDRSNLLKPVFHNTAQEESNKARSPSAKTTGLKHSDPHREHIRSKSGPSSINPWHQIQKTESSLEAEIRRKEALLKEKLRRTEEELRRIQREKEAAELEERQMKEIQEERRRATKTEKKATNHFSHFDHTLEGNVKERSLVGLRSGQQKSYQVSNTPPRSPSPPPSQLQKSYQVSNTPHRSPSPPPSELQYSAGRQNKNQIVSSNKRRETTHPPSPKHRSLSSRAQHVEATRYTDPTQESNNEGHEKLYSDSAPEVLDSELVPCELCGRNFTVQRLEKHTQVCEKMQSSKRKVFDSSKARVKGTDLEQYLQTKGRTQPTVSKVQGSTWRQKHEAFQRTIRQAREVQHVIAKGGKLSDLPPPPPDENPDYVTCPHCSRRFAPRVAERHIPKCETIKSKPRPPPGRRR
ncbi:zinc finger C2HC domain-containing protein 1C [Rhinophrynus dorsalis]